MSAPDPRAHLEGLARYARLAARQEEALESDDSEAFLRLTRERQELQDQLDALEPPEPGDGVDPEAVDEVVRALEAARLTDARIQRLARRHQEGARGQLAEAERRTDEALRYLRRDTAAPDRVGLDVTF